jgi:uncharacterized membrane protein
VLDARRNHVVARRRAPEPLVGAATMSWSRSYIILSYLRSSLWIVPFLAIPVALLATRAVDIVELWVDWRFLDLTPDGARNLLQTVITANLSFVVFTFGFLLVAIQVASGQLTPRIIATTLLRDPVVRYAVGLFIFTLLFAVSALNRMPATPRQLELILAALLGVSCFAAFLFVIDYTARLLRPITILTRLGRQGLAVVEDVYPELSFGPVIGTDDDVLGAPERVIAHQGQSEIVVAVNIEALTAAATAANGVVEFVPQMGDFVAVDEPLFQLYGGARNIDDHVLRDAVVFGPERTIEQDPAFAFRVVIDIALRALSAAINDPTTAVLAIDQLHRLLRSVGRRSLRTDRITDSAGAVRLIVRTPNWEDFVHLSFAEIRLNGGGSLQVVRRLRSMIVNLLQTLPKHRAPALRVQLDLLDREIERRFDFVEDAALARIPDSQGLGGQAGRDLQ